MPREAMPTHARVWSVGVRSSQCTRRTRTSRNVKNVRDGDALRTHVEKDAWTVSRLCVHPDGSRPTNVPTTARTGRDGRRADE